MTSILDLQGLNFKYLRQGDIVNFMKEFVKTMDHHYPQRANKTLIINAPKWFNLLYKIVSPLLRESTKAKIEIHTRGKRQDKVLNALLGNNDKAEKLFPASFFMKTKKKDKKDDRKQMMMMKNRRGMQTEVEEEDVPKDTAAIATDGVETPTNDDDDIAVDVGDPVLPSKFETELREFVRIVRLFVTCCISTTMNSHNMMLFFCSTTRLVISSDVCTRQWLESRKRESKCWKWPLSKAAWKMYANNPQ